MKEDAFPGKAYVSSEIFNYVFDIALLALKQKLTLHPPESQNIVTY